jgi:hypothetical protein
MIVDALVPNPYPYIDSDRGQRLVHERLRLRHDSEDPVAVAVRHKPARTLKNSLKKYGPVISRHLTAAQEEPPRPSKEARDVRRRLAQGYRRLWRAPGDVYSFLDRDTRRGQSSSAAHEEAADAAESGAEEQGGAAAGQERGQIPDADAPTTTAGAAEGKRRSSAEGHGEGERSSQSDSDDDDDDAAASSTSAGDSSSDSEVVEIDLEGAPPPKRFAGGASPSDSD